MSRFISSDSIKLLENKLTRRRLLSDSARGASLLALSGGAAAALAACGDDDDSSGGGGGEGGKIGFLVPNFQSVRWKNADQRFFEERARELGYDPITKSAEHDIATQQSQLESMITLGVKAIVLVAVDTDAGTSMVATAKSEGIPVVAYQFILDTPDIVGFVGRDDKQVGRDQAEAALKAYPEGNYVGVFGDQATSVARDKAAGALEVLKPHVDDGKVDVVAQQFIKGWDPDTARKFMENALTANEDDVQAAIVSADLMSTSVVAAVQEQGLAGDVFITGEDAELSSLKLIKEGVMGMTSFTPYDKMAVKAMDVAAAAIEDKPIESERTVDIKGTAVPWFVIDAIDVNQENIDQFVKDYPWWVKESDLA